MEQLVKLVRTHFTGEISIELQKLRSELEDRMAEFLWWFDGSWRQAVGLQGYEPAVGDQVARPPYDGVPPGELRTRAVSATLRKNLTRVQNVKGNVARRVPRDQSRWTDLIMAWPCLAI